MKVVRRRWKRLALALVLLSALFLYLNNTSMFFSARRPGGPAILVHRGMAQRYSSPDGFSSCGASQMLPPEHPYLENTIASMQAAFDRGADVVEFDIHATADGQFAVFHDRLLECRTNGRGITREHTIAQLKALDIGYGYTSDGGRTYPFRGKAVGLMPSMDELFERFPDKAFLIDIKGNEPHDGVLLASHLRRLPVGRRSKLTAFGRDSVLTKLREGLPDLAMFSTSSTASCLLRYIAYGWTGRIPSVCRRTTVWVPINIAPWLWGWPNRFLNRLEAGGSAVIVMGPYPAREISPGLDTPEDLARLPAGYNGGIWTNDVALIAAAVKGRPVYVDSPPSGP